jgi:Tfp pilus assembly protein PilV
MKAKVENRKNQRGFTLVETTISMVVMMVAGLAVSSLFIFSTQNNVGGNERALAMGVAQQQMEQLRSVSFDSTLLNVGTTTSTVSSSNRNYTVVKAITDEINPNNSLKQLRRITITVTPVGGARANWTRTPVTLVALRSIVATGSFAVQ